MPLFSARRLLHGSFNFLYADLYSSFLGLRGRNCCIMPFLCCAFLSCVLLSLLSLLSLLCLSPSCVFLSATHGIFHKRVCRCVKCAAAESGASATQGICSKSVCRRKSGNREMGSQNLSSRISGPTLNFVDLMKRSHCARK